MATIHLTSEQFKNEIFDYTTEKEWKYKGDIPAIIDFYANWCGPCKMVAPVLEELSNEYSGKLNIYKVDTEVEQELSAVFRIRSIPSILFIPKEDHPMLRAGALPKHMLEDIIKEKLMN